MKRILILSLGLCLSALTLAAAPVAPAPTAGPAVMTSIGPTHGDPQVPDHALTPGAWHDPPTPLATLCAPGHTIVVRHVSKSLKDQVFREYGYDPAAINTSDYEIDHLVSLELDGTNDITNLWPQSYVSEPLNAHRKDVLENTLHRLVCAGTLDLKAAQMAISLDWVGAYHKYVLHAGG